MKLPRVVSNLLPLAWVLLFTLLRLFPASGSSRDRFWRSCSCAYGGPRNHHRGHPARSWVGSFAFPNHGHGPVEVVVEQASPMSRLIDPRQSLQRNSLGVTLRKGPTYTEVSTKSPDLGEDGLAVPDRTDPRVWISYPRDISLWEECTCSKYFARDPFCKDG